MAFWSRNNYPYIVFVREKISTGYTPLTRFVGRIWTPEKNNRTVKKFEIKGLAQYLPPPPASWFLLPNVLILNKDGDIYVPLKFEDCLDLKLKLGDVYKELHKYYHAEPKKDQMGKEIKEKKTLTLKDGAGNEYELGEHDIANLLGVLDPTSLTFDSSKANDINQAVSQRIKDVIYETTIKKETLLQKVAPFIVITIITAVALYMVLSSPQHITVTVSINNATLKAFATYSNQTPSGGINLGKAVNSLITNVGK
jgi:hypothetical protein